MHIPDGILPAPVCVAGYAIAGGVTWLALKRINQTVDPQAEVPKAALLAAAFFVGSSISLPVPPASVHLVLNGLLGALLGWYAWLAILIGLFFQALFLGHGGLSTLGVNAIIIGVPALVGYGVFQLRRWLPRSLTLATRYGISGFLAGAIGMALAVTIFISLLIFAVPVGFDAATERAALLTLGVAHGPLIIVEGIFTALLVIFLQRTKPELLTGLAPNPPGQPLTNQATSPAGERLCD